MDTYLKDMYLADMQNMQHESDALLDVAEPSGSGFRTTTLEALLGMLSMRPMSGYELRATMKRSTANFWQESFGQIYPALRRLVSEGWAEVSEVREANKRFSKTYALTDLGRAQLVEWMQVGCERQTIRDELLLKLFFGVQSSPKVLLVHVRRRREEFEADLARYKALEKQLPEAQGHNPGLPYFLITLGKGLADADAGIRWCDETIKTIETLEQMGTTSEHELMQQLQEAV